MAAALAAVPVNASALRRLSLRARLLLVSVVVLLSDLLDLPAATTRQGVASLLVANQALKDEMTIPAGIRDTGVSAAEFEQRLADMVGQALRDSCTPTNPRTPDALALTELYRRAWTGNAVQGH